jgi:hypothetical protein
MEVHPPEHGIHSFRDFLVHMGTITLGLLIAIGLEATAQAIHHHHQVTEAREQIHHELEANRHTIAKDRDVLQKAYVQMRSNLTELQRDGPLDSDKLHFGWYWEGGESSAWQTVRDTGVVAFMPYEEVHGYANAYMQQATVDEAAKDYIKQSTKAIQPLLRHGDLKHASLAGITFTPEERKQLVQSCLDDLSQISLMLDLSDSLDELYRKAG